MGTAVPESGGGALAVSMAAEALAAAAEEGAMFPNLAARAAIRACGFFLSVQKQKGAREYVSGWVPAKCTTARALSRPSSYLSLEEKERQKERKEG